MAEVIANGESKAGFVNTERFVQENVKATESHPPPANRKEKRKAAKKVKRKLVRRQLAEKEREEEEARLNDPEEQLRMEKKEREEAEKAEREKKLFEEREAMWIERSRKLKEEAERKHPEESEKAEVVECDDATSQSDSSEYVEEGPAEIIWQGNEIIVKKKKIRVPKTSLNDNRDHDAARRPTSNPLPPQSALFDDYTRAASVSTEALFESVATQVPNFGTEQDKAHCPFHIKTGACRFGSRCNRVHFYPDKSCTLLLKNMYNGPGLAWEQDEGLESPYASEVLNILLSWIQDVVPGLRLKAKLCGSSYSEEEVELCFEDFYEDVHTEFLKFGEIINFKGAANGSSHLRGNVYVHYKYLESAILAYNSINGRFFAGKQVTCEFIGVTRWKVAICGEYMKASYKTCSRGSACNFLHCFRNPGGDYEWADRDSSRPRYWVEKMVSLFGPSARAEEERVQNEQIISRSITSSNSRHRSAKHRSPDTHDSNGDSRRENLDHDDRSHHRKHSRMMKPDRTVCGNLHEAECLDRDSDKAHSDDPGGHISGISRGRVHHRQRRSTRTADSFKNDDFDLPIMDRWTGDARSDEDRGPHRGGYTSKGGRYHLDRHGSCEKNDPHIDDHNRRKRSRASSGSITFDRKPFERYDSNIGNHNFNEVVAFSDDSVQWHDFQDGRISSKGDNKSSDDPGSSYQTQHDHHHQKRRSCSRERNRHVTKSKQKKMVVVDADTDELKPKEKIANEDEVTDGRSRLDAVDKKHVSKSSKSRDRKRQHDEESDTSDYDFDRRRKERWR